MENLYEKLKKIWFRYWLAILSGAISAIICLALMAVFFCRNYAIGILKHQFETLENTLQPLGYDFAYDELRFYPLSPWQIMRAKNFRIYSLDESNYWQWNIDELNIDVGLWDYEAVKVFLGSRQTYQHKNTVWNVFMPEADINVRLKNGLAKEIQADFSNFQIKNLLTANSIYLHLKRQTAPELSGEFDVKGIRIDDMTGWPLNKNIDHIRISSSLQGNWDTDILAGNAFYNWIDDGGYLTIHKMILNWKPLIMVANGEVIFNDKAEPTLTLNTASLALLEVLDKLNENGFILNKGTFVAKILLNNKAVLQKTTDKYKTVVSPLKISKDGVRLENIKIR